MLALTLGLVIQSTPINVESPGIRLVNLIPKLASEARLSLSVVPSLENDVVAIRTMGRPWGEVKANLAKVLNATWEEKDGRFTLMQTSEQQKAERDFQRESMIRLLTEKFAKLKKFYSPTLWTDQEFNKWFLKSAQKPSPEISPNARRAMELETRRGSPQGRLTARMINLIQPSQLIPEDLDWEAHAYATDRLVLHDHLVINLAESMRLFKIEKQMHIDHKGLEEGELLTKPVGAIIRPAMLRNASALTIDFYDIQGKIVDFFFDFDRSATSIQVQQTKTVSRLSQLWKDLLAAEAALPSRYLDDGSTMLEPEPRAKAKYLKVVDKVRNRLKQSQTEDPLALFGGDDWIQFSSERGQPVIALLGDAVSSALVASVDSPALSYGPFRLDKGVWILGSQRNLFATRTARADRTVLAKYADWVIKTGSSPEWFGIDGVFRRADALYELTRGKVFGLARLSSSDFEFSVENNDYQLLELIGAMTPDERLRLLRSEALPLKSLGSAVKNYFRGYMFRDGFALNSLDPRIPSVAFPGVENGLWIRAKQQIQQGFIFYEKTPTGLVRTGADTYDNLAYDYANSSLQEQPEALYLAPATSTKMTISLMSATKSVDQEAESAWHQDGPARSFSSLGKAFLDDLRKRNEQRSKDGGG